MKNLCKMPVQTFRDIIQPKIQMSHRQMENPNFPTLKAVGCESPMFKIFPT